MAALSTTSIDPKEKQVENNQIDLGLLSSEQAQLTKSFTFSFALLF